MKAGSVKHCQACREVYSSTSALTNHVRQVHQLSVRATFPSGSTYEIKRDSGGQFKCVCGRPFQLSNSLHRHVRLCKGNGIMTEPENTLEEAEGLTGDTVLNDDEEAPVVDEDEHDEDISDLSYDLVGISCLKMVLICFQRMTNYVQSNASSTTECS
jgi:hypothetical protein